MNECASAASLSPRYAVVATRVGSGERAMAGGSDDEGGEAVDAGAALGGATTGTGGTTDDGG